MPAGQISRLQTEPLEGPWLDPDEQRLWRALLTVHARLLGRLDDDLHSAHQIRLGDYDVLVQLSEAPERNLRMADLAGRLLLSPSGVTRRVDHLVREGLVTREPCPDDGRGSLARLSDAGWRRLQQAAPTHVAGVRRYLLSPALGSGGSLAGMCAGVDRVRAALDSTVGLSPLAGADRHC